MPFIDLKPRCPGICLIHCQGHDADAPERDMGDDIAVRLAPDLTPFLDVLINWPVVRDYDAYLDSEVGPDYKAQPMARDITRITKLYEETSEALLALGGVTGENPRKVSTATMQDVLGELGDAYLAVILAVQHFTKDPAQTAAILRRAMAKLETRNRERTG